MGILKKLSIENRVAGFFPFVKKTLRDFVSQSDVIREKLKDLPKTNFELGLRHLERGNLEDAIMRFKMVSFLVPGHKEAAYYLGVCLAMKGENDRASEALGKALALDPDYPQARYMQQKLKEPSSIAHIPDVIIADRLRPVLPAETLKSAPGYAKSRLLAATLMQNVADKNPHLDVLEVEAGSGLTALILKYEYDVVNRLEGVTVDTTLAQALSSFVFQGKPAYENCVGDNYLHFLEQGSSPVYDMIVIESAAKWFGDLSRYLPAIHRRLKPEGLAIMVLQLADLPRAEGFRLHPGQDEFSYAAPYVSSQAEAAGFFGLSVPEEEAGDKKIFLFRKKREENN